MTATAPKIVRPLVLLVDDEPAITEALTALLAPRLEPPFRVETAASAEEALEVVARSSDAAMSPVALVISDEKMPGRSGTDLLIALREHAAHRHGGRMIVTGYAGLASAQRAINDAEVDRYYPKPWDSGGDLLPAVSEILSRFLQRSELDRFLLVETARGPGDLGRVREIREAWREYVTLMGGSFSVNDEEPTPDDPLDEGATLLLARRLSPREDAPAATIRLRRTSESSARLEALAFQPEEAGDELEILLLRAATAQAAEERFETLDCDAPTLRREVYEAVGFVSAAGEKPGPPGTTPMRLDSGALRALSGVFPARWAATTSLCACSQSGCGDRDYAAARRGYFCPLDLRDGRVPEHFPVKGRR